MAGRARVPEQESRELDTCLIAEQNLQRKMLYEQTVLDTISSSAFGVSSIKLPPPV